MSIAQHDIEAERAVLGAMLLSGDAIDRATKCLSAAAFHHRSHGIAFKALAALRASGTPVDLITLSAALSANDELEAAGGPAALALWHESATSLENIEAHAKMVRAAYATRERVKVGLELASGASDSPEVAAATLARLEAIQRAVEGSESAAKKWAAASLSGQQLIEAPFDDIPSWLGEGVLPAGELAFLTGHSGVGKTFLVVQLMSALSIGHSFNGLKTKQCRVGLVELEMPWKSVQKRVAALSKGDLSNMAFLCSPPGALHIRTPEARENLAEFIRMHQLDVLVLDPFNRLHDDDENSGSDMGHVLEGFHELRRMTGVCILALHHVRKMPSGTPSGPQSRAGSLDSGRGSSRLTNDPSSCMVMDEAKGMVRLTFSKVRHAVEPLPIYLKRNERGFFDVADDPSLAKIKRADSLSQMLQHAGSDGITAETAAEILGVTARTVRRDLEELGASKVSRGKNSKAWVMDATEGELGL